MTDISSFRSQFNGDVVTPTDPGYKEAITRWAANAERNAKVVAFVKDEADVALAIKYAGSNGLSIAVRGGGHSTSSSSCEGGLVVDLSRYINQVDVDPGKKVIRVGGGALWSVVDKAAAKHGLATVAGTVSHVRLSGLI